MTKPTMSAEEALMRSQVNVNTASAIHTQTMAMRELENGGYYELAKGARDVLAVMLGMPEQAPKQQDTADQTADPSTDVVLIINGATGTGKGQLLSELGKLLLDRDFQVEGMAENDYALLIRDPVATFKRKAEQSQAGTISPDGARRERINAALDALRAEGIVVFPPLA